MLRARYGKNGELVTLKEFIEREGGRKPAQWVTKPYCRDPNCGRELQAYGFDAALNFGFVARELSGREKTRAVPGFHHRKHDAVEGCKYAYADDPRFEEHEYKPVDPHIHEKVQRVLFADNVLQSNCFAILQLWKELTGRKMDIEKDYRKAKETITGIIQDKKLYEKEGLGVHAWVVPFYVAAHFGPQERIGSWGPYEWVYKPEGERKLFFNSLSGMRQYITVPERLVLGFPRKAHKSFKPVSKRRAIFDVNFADRQRLARTYERNYRRVKYDKAHPLEQLSLFPQAPLLSPAF